MEGDGSQAASGSPGDSQHDPGLRDYFSRFGEVRECMVMRDPTTKRSRGFGFVTFADAASVDKVLAQPHHELDSKTIDPKVAFPRRAQPKMVTRTKKIFVGGLSANTVAEDVKQYFEQFGKVEDSMLMFDKTTNRHRGEGAEINIHVFDICSSHLQVECKKAQPKEVMFPPGTRGRTRGLPYTMDAFMLGMGMLSYPNIVATYGRGYAGFAPSYSYQIPGFPATAYGPVAAVAAARGSGRGARGRGGYMAYPQNAGPGFPDYGFYSAPSDQRGPPCSFADYSSLGTQAAQMLQTEHHATSACNSPLQHLHSPDQFKSPGSNAPRPGGFPGANSPGPVADLYGPTSQDSTMGNYISAASPQPGSGFGHSITVISGFEPG
uniref:RRM domain-containing protein n=1 Tax=Denticeps clupeoides TaxID=299321 RepID=A0AAY3ZXJ4_9TELE